MPPAKDTRGSVKQNVKKDPSGHKNDKRDTVGHQADIKDSPQPAKDVTADEAKESAAAKKNSKKKFIDEAKKAAHVIAFEDSIIHQNAGDKSKKDNTATTNKKTVQQHHHEGSKNLDRPPVIKVYHSHLLFSVFSLWPEKRMELEDAPEILILFKRPTSYIFGKDSCILRLFSCLPVCRNRVHASYGLANFKPLIARTNHTIEYVHRLVTNYSSSPTGSPASSTPSLQAKRPPSPSDTKGMAGQAGNTKIANATTLSAENNPKVQKGTRQEVLMEFYETSNLTLQFLQNAITLYKQMILNLSFSRYSEEELTPAEVKLTCGRSIVGSCMWVLTYALQQLQDNPEVNDQTDSMAKKKLHIILFDLATEILTLITLSFHVWSEVCGVIGVLERIHKKTEALFHKQNIFFHKSAPADSEDAILASVHLKKFRRSDKDAIQLRKFDPPAPALWTKKYGTPRILYKTQYTKEDSSWRGFDPLRVKDKAAHLKDLLTFVKRILESVMDSAGKIVKQLEGEPNHYRPVDTASNALLTHHHHHQIQQASVGITCYEDGLDVMGEILSKKLAHAEWNQREIREFFEIDKVFLDDMDLLTLGAGVTRAILHDARHTMHISYECVRIISHFKEFTNLPEYQMIHKRIKEGGLGTQTRKTQSAEKKFGNGKTAELAGGTAYDIEELPMQLRNVPVLFRSSPYCEIVKNLPIYCSQVGITLQDVELVFTPSSEKLLSKLTS